MTKEAERTNPDVITSDQATKEPSQANKEEPDHQRGVYGGNQLNTITKLDNKLNDYNKIILIYYYCTYGTYT